MTTKSMAYLAGAGARRGGPEAKVIHGAVACATGGLRNVPGCTPGRTNTRILSMQQSLWKAAALLAGLCPCWAGAAVGLGPDFDRLEAGLYARRDDLVVDGAATVLRVRIDRLGFRLSDIAHPRLSVGLLAGGAAADITGQTITNGMQPAGPYLGVAVGGAVFDGARGRVDFDVYLLYQSLDDEVSGQRVELDWLESGAALRLSVGLTAMLSLYAGPQYRNLDLDQRARGTLNATARFGESDTVDAVLGVTLETDPGGFVDVAVHRGASDGVMLAFRRRY